MYIWNCDFKKLKKCKTLNTSTKFLKVVKFFDVLSFWEFLQVLIFQECQGSKHFKLLIDCTNFTNFKNFKFRSLCIFLQPGEFVEFEEFRDCQAFKIATISRVCSISRIQEGFLRVPYLYIRGCIRMRTQHGTITV